MIDARLLGPLDIRTGAGPVELGPPKQRALMARLLLDANRTVPVQRLIDDLWGESAPPTAAKMVQIYVSQLRKALPEGLLATRPSGYAAELDDSSVDVTRFRRAHEEGRALLAAGDAAAASARLGTALGLWRGAALADFGEPFAEGERRHLEELRLTCVEDRIDAELACGRHDQCVAELRALVAQHPLRERLRARLMLALYRAGRQADALAAYREFRRTLDAELGIEPSGELGDLELAILRHDPALRGPEAPSPPSPPAARPAAARAGEVRYVLSGDVSIAYQVVGEGPLDLVLVHGWVCAFHAGWEYEPIARFYRGLTALGRLILFDKRGTGLSDRVPGIAPLDERMDDVRAVMDAAGSRRAVVLGISEGGPMAALFAATHPERTAALIAMGTFARRTPAPDYPIDIPTLAITPQEWGLPITRRWVEERAPSAAHDEDAVRWYASYFTRGASPSAAAALRAMNDEIDVRDVLSAIRVPTLVLYRAHEWLARATRDMGERIPGARVVELPGADHVPWEGDRDALLAEIERFLATAGAEPEPDRVLATVLHAEWGEQAGTEGEALASVLAPFRGRPLPAGRGALRAAFDGPARALRCALALVASGGDPPPAVGVHTGECEVADGVLRGVAVDLAAHVARRARAGEVLATATVRDLVAGSGLRFGSPSSMAVEVLGERREWSLVPVVAA